MYSNLRGVKASRLSRISVRFLSCLNLSRRNHDLKGWRSPVAKKFNVRAIPMNYLINQDGVIIAKNLRGFQLEETLKNLAE